MGKPPVVSEGRPRALFVSPESPYPTIGGGPLRSASVLEYLRRRYSVDAILFQPVGSPDPTRALPRDHVARSETIWLPRHSKQTAARVARNLWRMFQNRPPLFDRFSGFGEQIDRFLAEQSYDLAVIEHFWCAGYASNLRPRTKILWLNLHNIESVWHERLAVSGRFPFAAAHRRFARAYAELEEKLLPTFDSVLVTSEEDANQVHRIAPATRAVVYPNALPCFRAIEKKEEEVIAFSGNLEYEPNKAAVQFFRTAIWPLLRERWPQLKWRIIGKNPEAIARAVAGDDRIEVLGPVEDAVSALAAAKVVVVPLLAGSGTRIKILEAWAAATPVVSTSIGAEGLICQAGRDLLVADEPAQFAAQVSLLLESPHTRLQMGRAGRLLCQDRYTWEVAWRALDAVNSPAGP